MDQFPERKLTAALHEFSREAFTYCRGISDTLAREYAVEYARVLEDRAKGLDAHTPRAPYGLFEPHRNLIRSTLDRICARHLPGK